MKCPSNYLVAAALLGFSSPALAEAVDLPVPFLEWSFYVLLLFGLVVAIGIFIRRGKNGANEQLSGMFESAERNVHSVNPEISVTECVRRMNELRIGAMLVMENDRLVGIFTERDGLTRVLGAGLDPSATKVSAVMTADPTCVTPSTPLDEARSIITHQRIRHLPVVQDGKVLGMVSSGDLTHWLIRDQAMAIRDLVDTASR
jgi:CBS domain-containing protein